MTAYSALQYNNPHNKGNAITQAIAALGDQVKKMTKQLKLGRYFQAGSEKKKLIVSTNWLPSFGFEPGVRVVEEVRAGQLVIRLATATDEDTKLVYQRKYNNRKTNAEEAQLDIRSQRRLQEAFGDADEVHLTFTPGKITARPVGDFAQQATALGALIEFPQGEGMYAALAQAVSIIRERKFSKVEFASGGGFDSTREYTFFCMHLRRLGYEIHNSGTHTLASIPNVPCADTEWVDLRSGRCEIEDFKEQALSKFNFQTPLESAGMMTSGVDLTSAAQEEFVPTSVLEYRPLEERDEDKEIACETTTEGAQYTPVSFKFVKKTQKHKVQPLTVKTGALNRDFRELGATTAALSLPSIQAIFNEDVYRFDPRTANAEFQRANVVMGGLQCDDFSSLKSKSEREKSIENLGSTADMLFPALHAIETAMFPVVTFENVAPFEKSEEFKVFTGRLKQLGYSVHSAIMRGEHNDSYTMRPRNFIVATLLGSDFSFPEAIEHQVHWWNDIVVANPELMRSLPRTQQSIQSALEENRMNLVAEGSKICRTLVKSDAKYVKDSVSVELDGHYYFLPAEIMAKTMSIPESYRYDLMPTEFQRELIGQSVCCKMHSRLMARVREHIMNWANGVKTQVSQVADAMTRPIHTQMATASQLSLW